MDRDAIHDQSSGYTVMYQIWMKPGSESELAEAWSYQKDHLNEVGVLNSWVNICDHGRCEAFLLWESKSHWEELQPFINFIDEMHGQLGEKILGWLSPVAMNTCEKDGFVG